MLLKIVVLCLIGLSFCAVPWIGTPRESQPESWFKHHQYLVNQTETHKDHIQLVFLGDSITAHWLSFGQEIWDKYYSKPRHAYNYGIGGDRTENVIYRIENKELDGIKPKALVLMIGINNIHVNTPVDIAKGIEEIKRQLVVKLPATNLLIMGVLPISGHLDTNVKQINKIISTFADNKKVHYLDMTPQFETAPGKQVAELFNNDSLHPNSNGYEMWYKTMEPTLKTLLNEN